MESPLLLIVLGLVLCQSSGLSATRDNERFDCLPGMSPSEAVCKSRGCVWELPNKNIVSRLIDFLVHGLSRDGKN